MQWKIAKLGGNKSFSLTQVLENKQSPLKKSQRSPSNDEALFALTPESMNVIEKRLKDLELSREVESSENFKKISKLEKIVEGIKKEKSLSPASAGRSKKKLGKNRSTSVKNVKKQNSLKEKPKKLCVYIRDLEEEAEKWKKKAQMLAKKYGAVVRSMRSEIKDIKNVLEYERAEFREYCNELLQKRSNF